MNRRQFLGALGLAGMAAAIPVALTTATERSRRTVRLWNDGGPPLRIAHLSDLHSSPAIPLRHIEDAVGLVLSETIDAACLTGDFVTRTAPDPAGLVRILRRLSSAAPTFACLGNHDGGRWSASHGGSATPDAVVEMLDAAGIRLLRDETERFSARGRDVLLTGVEDLWSFDIDPLKAGIGTAAVPRIVLAHNPDTKDALAREPWDLMLSGHTHGGQIRLPFLGGRLTAPVRDDRYIEGLLPWGSHLLHISRGVGCLHGIRINCPPEVTVLELG